MRTVALACLIFVVAGGCAHQPRGAETTARSSVHPALPAGIVIGVVGLFLLIPGAVFLSAGPGGGQSGSCDVCGLEAGLGQKAAGGVLLGVGAFHFVVGGVTTIVGATAERP